VALPNLLADELLVPEFLEGNTTLENISIEVMKFFNHPYLVNDLQKRFEEIHKTLRCGGSEMAAKALSDLIDAP